MIPDEVERVDADEVIPALTRLCIKHALRASASSSSVDADADAAVVAPADTQPIIVLENEEPITLLGWVEWGEADLLQIAASYWRCTPHIVRAYNNM